MQQILFQARIDSLEQVLDWIEMQTQLAGLSGAESRKIEIALEEAIVNVIHYAYRDKGGDIELSCYHQPAEWIEFIIKDCGPFFNPLGQTIKQDQQKEGGLGIPLMRHYMDRVQYQRSEPYNLLTLTRYLK